MSSTRKDRLVFLDLETSDSDETASHAAILEVGITVTDIWGRIVKQQNFLNWLTEWQRERVHRWDEVVFRMHTDNGLLTELLYRMTEEPEESLDERVYSWLTQDQPNENIVGGRYNPALDGAPLKKGELLVLAGSGVSHFDRRWVRKFMPLTDSLFTHYAIEVGSDRRMIAMHAPSLSMPEKQKTHRALECNRDTIAQYTNVVDILRSAADYRRMKQEEIQSGGTNLSPDICGVVGPGTQCTYPPHDQARKHSWE